jgi:predicted enzyme related to lactoylglutathione lyase
MLRKIDCVMVKVDDLEAAARYYAEVLGLKCLWADGFSIGMGMPETDAEIVLHNDPDLPKEIAVHYLVDDVVTAAAELESKGCTIIAPPFDIAIGKCAVIQDPFGTILSILDMTKGPRSQLS